MPNGLIMRTLWGHVGAVAVLTMACGSPSGPDYATGNNPTSDSGDSTTGTDSAGSASGTGSTGMDSLGSDSNSGTTTGATTGPPPVEVFCDDPPQGAVGADYAHTFSAMGGTGSYSWSATGLPDGVIINPVTGALSGTATTEGSYDVEITASSGVNPPIEGTETCTIDIAAGLSVDLGMLGKPCAEPGDDILQFVTGGNGAAITCDTPGGTGNGKVPAGVSVDAATCMHAGSITETRYGTWVWMTRLEQSGAEAWVPFCQSQTNVPGGFYTVYADHDGLTDAALVPGSGTFTPGQPISYGGNAGDPMFRITGGCGGNSCYFGFAFGINASPFDGNTFSLAPSALYQDMNNVPQGFTHEMTVTGPAVPTKFEDRIWVLNVALDYCMSDMNGPCTGVANIKANGNGNLEYGIIMTPQ